MASIRKSSKKKPSKSVSIKATSSKRNTQMKNMDVSELVVVGLLLITLVAGYYYIYSKNLNVESFSNANLDPKEGEIVMVLFYTNWCPHCTKFKPTWEDLKSEMDNQKVGNNNVRIESVDCEANPDLGKKYKVNGYPTIKLLKPNSKPLDYEGGRGLSEIKQYIENI